MSEAGAKPDNGGAKHRIGAENGGISEQINAWGSIDGRHTGQHQRDEERGSNILNPLIRVERGFHQCVFGNYVKLRR